MSRALVRLPVGPRHFLGVVAWRFRRISAGADALVWSPTVATYAEHGSHHAAWLTETHYDRGPPVAAAELC
jgi:hypothetical protein